MMELFSILAVVSFTIQHLPYGSTHFLEYQSSGDDEDLTTHLNSIQSNKIGSLTYLQKLNPGIVLLPRNPHENTTFILMDMIKKQCNTERDCGSKNTCNIYTRKCERCRDYQELCRRNANCCDGLKCIWGRCRTVDRSGEEYSLCNTNADCQPNFCCAREHGQSVCKHYLQIGEKCDHPLGGLDFSVKHKCPCQTGLSCKRISSGRKRCVT